MMFQRRGASMKKGFTLIELLVVIIIWGIIAVITVPVMINVTSNTEEKAFVDDANMLLKSANQYYAETNLNTGAKVPLLVTYTNGMAKLTGSTVGLEYQGQNPTSGAICIKSTGEVEMKLYSANVKKCVEKKTTDKEAQSTSTAQASCVITACI